MTFNITIGPSPHGSDDYSSSEEEDSSGVQVSPPSDTGSQDYQDPYDEWAGLPYPDELKPSDSASRPRTSNRPRSRHPTHGSSAARRHPATRHQHTIQERGQFSRRRRPPSPESPESLDSADEYGPIYGRMPPDRRPWQSVGPGPGYPGSPSPGPPPYVYPNAAHAPFPQPNGSHAPSDQLIRLGHHNQFGQPAPYGHPGYPFGHLPQSHGSISPFFTPDGHPAPTAHHASASPHSRSEGHGQQHPLQQTLQSHSPSPFPGPVGSHEVVPYGPGGFYQFRDPYNMGPGAMSPYYNAYPRVPSPNQIEPSGHQSIVQGDVVKDEAIARLEKLILEERTEREAREAREAARERAIQQEAAEHAAREERAAHEKKITEEAAANARAEAEKKAAEEAAKAKKEAEDAAAAAAEEAAAKATAAANEAAAEAAAAAAAANKPPEKKKPIKFKDALGRKFSFPFDLCCTWQGMEELIRQAFLHIEVIGPHVAEGHYDLVGPNGDIILPQVWETVIEPDWTITMHMWPIPEKQKDAEGSPSGDAPADGAVAAEPSGDVASVDAAKKKSDPAGPKKPKAKTPDPSAFAMWMVGSSNRSRLNKALKVGKKPRIVQQHGQSCRVM